MSYGVYWLGKHRMGDTFDTIEDAQQYINRTFAIYRGVGYDASEWTIKDIDTGATITDTWTDGGDGYQYRDTSTLNGWTIVEIREKSTGARFYSAYRDGDQLSDMGYYDSKDQIERAIRGY